MGSVEIKSTRSLPTSILARKKYLHYKEQAVGKFVDCMWNMCLLYLLFVVSDKGVVYNREVSAAFVPALTGNTNQHKGFKRRHNSKKHDNYPKITNNSTSSRGSIGSTFQKGISIIILFTTCYAIASLYTFSQRYSCLKDIQIDELKKDLYQQVIAQEEVVDIALKSVEDLILQKDNLQLLVFVGSNGVGKTFIAELVASHFPSNFVHHLAYPEKLSSFTIDDKGCCKLVILDNLKSQQTPDLVQFLNTLRGGSQCSLVIAIFNIQELEDNFTARIDFAAVNNIQNTLANILINYKVVFFNSIKKSVIDLWLSNELDIRNIDKSQHDRIIKFVTEDFDFAYSGFKHLHEKLKLAVNMYDI